MDVIFEATRRCNLRCGHCLRGEPQSVDITKRVVWALVRLLSQLHNDEKSMYTGCVTMSGGEPTLNPSALEWWNTAVEGFQLSYGSFFVSTNGAQLTPRFLGSLFEAQMRSDADELYCLRLSQTQYHTKAGQTIPTSLVAHLKHAGITDTAEGMHS